MSNDPRKPQPFEPDAREPFVGNDTHPKDDKPMKQLLILECPKCHAQCYSNEDMEHEEGCEDYGFN